MILLLFFKSNHLSVIAANFFKSILMRKPTSVCVQGNIQKLEIKSKQAPARKLKRMGVVTHFSVSV